MMCLILKWLTVLLEHLDLVKHSFQKLEKPLRVTLVKTNADLCITIRWPTYEYHHWREKFELSASHNRDIKTLR